MEWNGMEWNGMEWNGMEWNGMEWNGMEWNGMEEEEEEEEETIVALGEEAITALVEKFKALVEAQGTVTEIDEWGKRRLAYPINDLNEGDYVLMTFNVRRLSSPLSWIVCLKITDGVMRSMIICKDAVRRAWAC